jgi:hypothetical protein
MSEIAVNSYWSDEFSERFIYTGVVKVTRNLYSYPCEYVEYKVGHKRYKINRYLFELKFKEVKPFILSRKSFYAVTLVLDNNVLRYIDGDKGEVCEAKADEWEWRVKTALRFSCRAVATT